MLESIEDLIWVNAHTPPVVVTIYLYINDELRKLESISKFPVPEFIDGGFRESTLVSNWSVPNREQMEAYRRRSSVFNAQAMSVMVDELLLSDCVVQSHLKGLSIDEQEIELERDEHSNLTTESLRKLKDMHTGLYDLMYQQYRTEACLFT